VAGALTEVLTEEKGAPTRAQSSTEVLTEEKETVERRRRPEPGY
jgi:hypothetical protein